MGRTIPGKVPSNWPRGTYKTRCDYCGAAYMRHELRRNEAGFLVCPTDAPGRDEVLLSRLNAEHAAQVTKQTGRYDGGAPDSRDLPVIHRTTASDITRFLA